MRHLLAFSLILCSCVTDDELDDDGPDDSFGQDGKADGAISGPDALRALRAANTADVATLRAAKVSKRAAENMLERRAGADGVAGTADDLPFYSLSELDAVSYVGPVTLDRIVAYGKAHPELLDPSLRLGALPPELANDIDAAGLITALASEPSLALDGDSMSLLSSEWELSLLYAHHFAAEVSPRIAALRPYLFGSDARRGPFVNVGTLYRELFGEGELGWMIAALLDRTAVDPLHTAGRLYASELESALADPTFVANYPSVRWFAEQFLSVWNAQVEVGDPGTFPIDRARVRALLTSRNAPTFDEAYPVDQPLPTALASTVFPMPFPRGTEIVCMQGNNSMSAQASHGPRALRYALDLNALGRTPLVASAAGTAYVYDNGRPNSFDNWGYGNILLIDLHNGYALFYAHLATFDVVTGQSVVAGQRVGSMGITGAAGPDPHLHFQIVPLFRTPDPENEKYQSDTPIPRDTPFGGPEPFLMSALDVTAGDTTAQTILSTAFVGGEAGWLRGAAHVYRAE